MSMELFLVGCYFLVELFNNNVLNIFIMASIVVFLFLCVAYKVFKSCWAYYWTWNVYDIGKVIATYHAKDYTVNVFYMHSTKYVLQYYGIKITYTFGTYQHVLIRVSLSEPQIMEKHMTNSLYQCIYVCMYVYMWVCRYISRPRVNHVNCMHMQRCGEIDVK